jgi:hypothetical protein
MEVRNPIHLSVALNDHDRVQIETLYFEIEQLRDSLEDAINTLEAMDLHIDNPLYDRMRAVLERVALSNSQKE